MSSVELRIHNTGSSFVLLEDPGVDGSSPTLFHGGEGKNYVFSFTQEAGLDGQLVFSETDEGPEYLENVTRMDNKIQILVDSNSPRKLYYYNANSPGFGGYFNVSDDITFYKTDQMVYLTEAAPPTVSTAFGINYVNYVLVAQSGDYHAWRNSSRSHSVVRVFLDQSVQNRLPPSLTNDSKWITIKNDFENLVIGAAMTFQFPEDSDTIEGLLFNSKMVDDESAPSGDDIIKSGGDQNIVSVRLDLGQLASVDLTSVPEENHILAFGADQKWKPQFANLAMNSDVTLENISQGDLLRFNATDGLFRPAALALNDLEDVTIANAMEDQVIQFVSGEFKNKALMISLDSLTDVSAQAPENGQYISFDSGTSRWVPTTPGVSPDFSQVSTEDFRLTDLQMDGGMLKGDVTFSDISIKGVYFAVPDDPVELAVHGNESAISFDYESAGPPYIFFNAGGTRNLILSPSGFLTTANLRIEDSEGNLMNSSVLDGKVNLMVTDDTPETLFVKGDLLEPAEIRVRNEKYLQFTSSTDNYALTEENAEKLTFGRDSSGRDYISYQTNSINYSHSDKFAFHNSFTGDDIIRSDSFGWWRTDVSNVSGYGITLPSEVDYLSTSSSSFPPFEVFEHAGAVPASRSYFIHNEEVFYQTDVMNENYEIVNGQPERQGSRKVYQSATSNNLIIYNSSAGGWRMLSESLPSTRPVWSEIPYFIKKDGVTYNRYGTSFYYYEKTTWANTSKTLRTGGNKPLWRASDTNYWIWDIDESKWYKVNLQGNESSGSEISLFKITAFSGESNTGVYPYYRPSGSTFTATQYFGWFVSDGTGSYVSGTSAYDWPHNKAKIPYIYLGNSTYPNDGNFRSETNYVVTFNKEGNYPIYRNSDRSISIARWVEDATRSDRNSLTAVGSGWLALRGDAVAIFSGTQLKFRSRTLSDSFTSFMALDEEDSLTYPVAKENTSIVTYNDGTTTFDVDTLIRISDLSDVVENSIPSDGQILKFSAEKLKFEIVDDLIIPGSQANQTVAWNGSRYEAVNPLISNNSDVLITDIGNNQFLAWDSTISRFRNVDSIPQHVKVEDGVISLEQGELEIGTVEVRNLETNKILLKGSRQEIDATSSRLVSGTHDMYFDESTNWTWIWSNRNNGWIAVNGVEDGVIIEDLMPEWQIRYGGPTNTSTPNYDDLDRYKLLRNPENSKKYITFQALDGYIGHRHFRRRGENWYIETTGVTSRLWHPWDPLNPNPSEVIGYSIENPAVTLVIPSSAPDSRAWGDYEMWDGLNSDSGNHPFGFIHVGGSSLGYATQFFRCSANNVFSSTAPKANFPIFKHKNITNRYLIFVGTDLHAQHYSEPLNGGWYAMTIDWTTFKDVYGDLVISKFSSSTGNASARISSDSSRAGYTGQNVFKYLGFTLDSGSYRLETSATEYEGLEFPAIGAIESVTREGWAIVTGLSYNDISWEGNGSQFEISPQTVSYLTGAVALEPQGFNKPTSFEFVAFDWLRNADSSLAYPEYTDRFSAELLTGTVLKLGSLRGVNKSADEPTENDVIQFVDGEWKNSNFLRTGDFFMSPTPGVTPVNNGEFTIRVLANNKIEFVLRGSDGVVRTSDMFLA
jgi:hypothetical protein